MLEYKIKVKAKTRVLVEIQNVSGNIYKALIWNSIFSGIEMDVFNIKDENGIKAKYIGPRYKFVFDQLKSVRRIEPNETMEYEVELRNLYLIEGEKSYTVELKNLHVFDSNKQVLNIEDAVLDDTIWINTGDSNFKFPNFVRKWNYDDPEIKDPYGEINTPGQCPIAFCVLPGRDVGKAWCRVEGTIPGDYISKPICSQSFSAYHYSQILSLTTTLSLNDLKVKVENNAMYKRWFGTYSFENAAIVQRIISGAQPSRRCKVSFFSPGWYHNGIPDTTIASAYKVPNSKTIAITLYPKFWTLPFSGMDSKIGTLIHEFSHGRGDTDDHAYGTAKCLNLAISRPDLAIDNADNYEYFAEEQLGHLNPF